MVNVQEREKRVVARCSPAALEYLQGLRAHPLYVVLTARLERQQGTLFQLDVERTFVDVVKRHRCPVHVQNNGYDIVDYCGAHSKHGTLGKCSVHESTTGTPTVRNLKS
jgi:hypothetical protein